MKSKYMYPLFLVFVLTMGGIVMSGCQEDESVPFISYIRVTNPAAADSLIVSAGQGQMLAIIGGNLQSVREIWFNDRKATIIPTFVTNNSVLVRVPSAVPDDITNQIKLIFANDFSLDYGFEVKINKPVINYLNSEYVNAGGIAVIKGNYFYAPITVTFTGGAQGEVVSIKDDEVQVKVPAGAQPGPITVASNFGQTESRFWFRDNRNIIASFDIPLNAWVWQGPAYIVASDPNISNINGKFMRVNKGKLGASPYLEVYGGSKEQGSDICVETKKIPEDAFSSPEKFSFKFEINTQESLVGAGLRIYMGNASNSTLGGAREASYYQWNSNTDSKGTWQTITIPWNLVYEKNKQFPYSAEGYAMFLYFHGEIAATYNFGLDNIRVVPN